MADAIAVHLLRRHAVLPPVARRLGTEPGALSPDRLRRLSEYIEAQLGSDLTLEDIAKEVCLSPFQLSRCFRRTTGSTLHACVMRRRAERARVLLRDPALPLAEIAHRCGFASQSHFTAVFKRTVGLTPGSYRRTALP
jgi:AraC family transcriptional regulator